MRKKTLKEQKKEFETALLIAFGIFLIIIIASVLVSDNGNKIGISGHAIENLNNINSINNNCMPNLTIIIISIIISISYLLLLHHYYKKINQKKPNYTNIIILFSINTLLYLHIYFKTLCEGYEYIKMISLILLTFFIVITFIYVSIFQDNYKKKKILQ
ncbi:MAG: hypothetical protein U9R08_01385 [Nanoarchaeota archaeon]|nr:hypothetical protein [Nanoarchaeota archaeon]